MRENFAKSNLKLIMKYNKYSEEEQEKLQYGLEVLYTVITKTLGVILLAVLLQTYKEAILLMVLYMFMRLFGHGIHATKSYQCWIASILCYGIFPLMMKYMVIPKLYVNIMWIIAFITFLIWAPADTPKKPLINKKRRMADKIITCLLSISLLIISFYSTSVLLTNGIFFSLIMGTIAVHPLTYKLFHIPFNNYKNFNLV